MRYLKQTTFIFILCGILGIPTILGGCTAEDGTDSGNGTAGSRVPLSIRATANGFDGLPDVGQPLTRTPVENGNATTFSNGDAIGLFAIKDGAIADGINNAKLTYSAGADGAAGSWSPDAGTVLYWYEGVSYVAYYPYKDGITIDATQTMDQIIASLAANNSLQPTADQSGSDGSIANYTACDLMTASGTPTAAGSNPPKQVLTLNFEHQFALLVLEPQAYMECTAPADGGFVYRANSKAPATDPNVASAMINSVNACRMSDGTYRVLAKPTAGISQIAGSYLTSTDNKEVSFNGSSIAAGFAAGHCYKVEVIRSTPNTTNTVERALAPGDFVFHGTSGIEVYPGNGLLADGKIPDYSNAIGMVTTCDPARMTDEGCNNNGWNHAYVMGLVNCGGSMNWGPDVDESVLPNIMRDNGAENNMNGYTETEAMLTERASKGDLGSYGTFNAISTYRSGNAVPTGLSAMRSPWFVPSVGQWFDVMVNICGKSPKTFRNNSDAYSWIDNSYGTEMWNAINSQLNKVDKPLYLIKDFQVVFLCSSEADASNGGRVYWIKNASGVALGFVTKSLTYAERVVRPFFSF